MHHKLCNLTPTQWSTDPRQAVLPIDVVGVNVFDLAQLLPVQAGVEVDAAAVADGNDATVAGQAGKVTTNLKGIKFNPFQFTLVLGIQIQNIKCYLVYNPIIEMANTANY